MLTTVNTHSSRNEVVPPRVARSANQMRPNAMSVVKMIDTYGVRRPGCTLPRGRGSTSSCAMPYRSREAMSMLIRAELATANIVMNAKMPTGKAGAPAATT